MIDKFIALGIEPKGNRPQQKLICPNCVKLGKINIKDTCLSIDLNDGLYNCFKCGWSGKVKEDNYFQNLQYKRTYTKPNKNNMSKLVEKDTVYDFFALRGISSSVVDKNKIVSTKDKKSVVFPYFKDGELINFKTRGVSEKTFMQAKDAEPIMYNYDRIKEAKKIIVCEGEIDALSWEEAGFDFHTSVNQGAPNEKDTNVDKKLECITNCYDAFEQAETIYLSVDNDANGKRLEKELIRRLGVEKCRLINFGDCKDANEYLLKNGKDALGDLLHFSKEVQVEGVFSVDDVYKDLLEYFENGDLDSESTHIEDVDDAWKWRAGEVTLWTGYQNEGKSLFLNQLALIKAIEDGDKFAVFSPENMPLKDFYVDLIETYIGKTSNKMYKSKQMTKDEFIDGMGLLNSSFFLVYPEFNFKLDTIFEKVKVLIRKKGVKHLIIDPYNTVEHMLRNGEREDLYISRFMATLKRFAIDNNITIQLVAHQLTARPNPADGNRYFKPNLNNIKGGGTFADKADNVCIVWRPNRNLDFRDTAVIFGSQKIKKQKLVARPCDVDGITFDIYSNRYLFNGKSPFEKYDKARGVFNESKTLEMPPIKDMFDINEENDIPF